MATVLLFTQWVIRKESPLLKHAHDEAGRDGEVSQGQAQKNDLDKLKKRTETEKMKFTEDECEVPLCGRQSWCASANWDSAGSGDTVRHKVKMRGVCGRFCGCLDEGRSRADVAEQRVQSSAGCCVEWGQKDAQPGQPLPSSSRCFLLSFKCRIFPCVLIAQAPNWI